MFENIGNGQETATASTILLKGPSGSNKSMESVISLLGIVIGIAGIVFSWWITRRYYLKSLDAQRNEFSNTEKDYRRIIEKFVDKGNGDSAINKKLLEEKRIEQCVEKYAQTGGGPPLITLIDTYTDLSNNEKADLLDVALLRGRGRKAKDNPFRKRDAG